jgi:tetratricopeptide (TPR) repeat protein
MYKMVSICKRGAAMMKSSLIQINLIFILLVFFIPNLASAELKTFITEYTYQASEYDSKVTCRAQALEQAKRLLLEELGTYLESETEVKNFKLTKDQIKTYTAGIVRTKIISEKWDTDSLKYWLKASMIADPQEVVTMVNSLRQDLQKTRELEEIKKKFEEQSAEIERLKNDLKTDGTNKNKIAQYMKAIEVMNALEMFRKGIELSISGKLQEAVNELNDAILKNPGYALAYGIRGHLNAKLGKNDKAIEDASKAIELDPNFALAYVSRAYIYYRLNDFKKGMIDANRAIELDPNYAFAYVIRGANLCGLGNNQEALEDGEKAVKLSPDNAYAYLCRSAAHSGLGNNIRAYMDLRTAINLDPDSAEVYIMRAFFERIKGNYDEGLDYMNKAIKLDPYNAQAFFNRGMIYFMKKEYSQAVADFNRTIDIVPKSTNAYVFRGSAYLSLGNYQQTIEDLNKAIELNPRSDKIRSEAHAIRGNAYSKLGNNEQAISEWKTAAGLGHKGAQNLLKQKGIDW